MRSIILICLALIFISLTSLYAAEEPININDIAQKMQSELNLSAQQVEAVKPIIKADILKRQAFSASLEGELIIDKKEVQAKLLRFKNETNEKLSKVLSPEQMKKRIEKQNLRESLNKDQINYSESLETNTGLNIQGASFQF